MKYFFILFLNILCISFSSSKEQFQIPDKIKTSVSNEIVSNYLNKYFNKKYVLITLSSSNLKQKYFQDDLICNLLKCTKFHNFSYKLVNNINNSSGAFYLLFVDTSSTLT